MRIQAELPHHSRATAQSDHTQQDLRGTEIWEQIETLLGGLIEPTVDKVSAATHLAASPDGKQIAFTGSIYPSNWQEAPPKLRICVLDVETTSLEVITAGPNDEILPKWSPDGRSLAFLSDRTERGIFQLYLLNVGRIGEAKPIPFLSGAVENFHWSPDGSRILLQSAGRNADKDDAGGSGKVGPPKTGLPSWMPTVDAGDVSDSWRTLWVYDLKQDKLMRKTEVGYNPWETAWCGPNAAVSIVSEKPVEDAWYNTTLSVLSLNGDVKRVVYRPKRQLGCPAASPSGKKVAVIEAVASDRGVIAGNIKLIDVEHGSVHEVDSRGVDVTHMVWKDETTVFFIGLCGLDNVAGEYSLKSDASTLIWETHETCTGGFFPIATLLPDEKFAVILESRTRVPEIGIIDHGKSTTLLSFRHKGHESLLSNIGPMTTFTWHGSDGLEIQGLLCLPKEKKFGQNFPLVVSVHGGPIYLNQNRAGAGIEYTTLLNSRGYAVLSPNPRGSAGRGQAFAEAVIGDMGGEDAQDILLGIKALCKSKHFLIDSHKIGIVGESYGGYMASLLPTLDPCFKASFSISGVTDWFSFHTTSNVGAFDTIFLDADPFGPHCGPYRDRSPIINAGKYDTPVLQTAGSNDLAVPSSQAVQYHRAMLEKGRISALAIYPDEGHGVRSFPAVIDIMTRMVLWFERFMPA